MKKLLTVILSLSLLASAGVQVLAASGSAAGLTVPSTQQIDVNAKYTDNSTTPIVYSVDVNWGAMQFTYTKSGTRVWNADSFTFTDNTTDSWSAVGNTVTVVNHSNNDVSIGFAFAKDSTINDAITGTFDVTAQNLKAGVENKKAEADSVTSTLTLAGTLAASRTSFQKIGTVTVTLAPSRK